MITMMMIIQLKVEGIMEQLVEQLVGQGVVESLVKQLVEQLVGQDVVESLVEQLAVPPDAVEGTAGITAATTSFEAMCHPEGTDQWN